MRESERENLLVLFGKLVEEGEFLDFFRGSSKLSLLLVVLIAVLEKTVMNGDHEYDTLADLDLEYDLITETRDPNFDAVSKSNATWFQKFTGKENYHFGDFSIGLFRNTVGRTVLSYTGRPEYKFGDISRTLVSQVRLRDSNCSECHRRLGVTVRATECLRCRSVLCRRCCAQRICSRCEDTDDDALRILPVDVVVIILSMLARKDIAAVSRVRRLWHVMVLEETVWYTFLERDYPNYEEEAQRKKIVVFNHRSASMEAVRFDNRSLHDVYQMMVTKEYIPIRFSERPLYQQIGIGVGATVGAPVILLYLTPRILRGVASQGHGACTYIVLSTKNALCTVGGAIDKYAVRPVLHLLGRGVSVLYHDVIVPAGQTTCHVVRFTVITVPVYLYEHAVAPASSAIYTHALVPTWDATMKTMKFIMVTAPTTVYNKAILPAAQALHINLLVPSGRVLHTAAEFIVVTCPTWAYRNVLAPTLKTTAELVSSGISFVAHDVLVPILRATARYIFRPVGNAMWVTVRFTFLTMPSLVYHYVVCPIGIAAKATMDYVLAPLGHILYHAAHFIGVVIPQVAYQYTLRPLAEHVVVPVLKGVVTVVTVSADALWKAFRYCGSTTAQAVVWTARQMSHALEGAHGYIAMPLYHHVIVPLGNLMVSTCAAFAHGVVACAHGIHSAVMVPVAEALVASCRAMWSLILVPSAEALGRLMELLWVNMVVPLGHMVAAVGTAVTETMRQVYLAWVEVYRTLSARVSA